MPVAIARTGLHVKESSLDRLTARQLYDGVHERMALRWISGMRGESRALDPGATQTRRPSLIGYLNVIYPNKVQIIGSEELKYLDALDSRQRWKAMHKIAASEPVANGAAPQFGRASTADAAASVAPAAERDGGGFGALKFRDGNLYTLPTQAYLRSRAFALDAGSELIRAVRGALEPDATQPFAQRREFEALRNRVLPGNSTQQSGVLKDFADGKAGGLAGIGAWVSLAVQGAQERAQEQDRANHRRRRVAGQAKDPHGADPPMHQRLAGTHGDAPEAELHPGRDQSLLHQVVIADRGAAGRDHDVRFRHGERGSERVEAIGDDTGMHDVDREIGDQRRQHRAVPFGQRERIGASRARRDKFVSGRQERNPQAAIGQQVAMPAGRRQRDRGR